MSGIMDKLRTASDIGQAIKALRKASGLTTTEISERSGRSRDVLHRLEAGSDVSLRSLIDLLAAMGHGIQFIPLGRPTLEEVRRRRALEPGEDE
jgi:transcriptional regulator with XRE-family HTH domain